jgi:hypothetical protein
MILRKNTATSNIQDNIHINENLRYDSMANTKTGDMYKPMINLVLDESAANSYVQTPK